MCFGSYLYPLLLYSDDCIVVVSALNSSTRLNQSPSSIISPEILFAIAHPILSHIDWSGLCTCLCPPVCLCVCVSNGVSLCPSVRRTDIQAQLLLERFKETDRQMVITLPTACSAYTHG